MRAYILDESAMSGAAGDECHIELRDGYIWLLRFDGTPLARLLTGREANALAYQLCLAADASDEARFAPIRQRPARGASR